MLARDLTSQQLDPDLELPTASWTGANKVRSYRHRKSPYGSDFLTTATIMVHKFSIVNTIAESSAPLKRLHCCPNVQLLGFFGPSVDRAG